MAHHHHIHDGPSRRLVVSIVLNLAITVAEVIGGLVSGSLALLSDAMHNLNDTASLGISYATRRLGKKPADPRRTYGYKRAEILGAFVNLVVLVVIGLFLIKEAVERYLHPREVNAPIMLSVAVVGLIANVVTAVLLHREAKSSLNIRSAFLHIVSDAVSSVAVIAGGVAILTLGVHWVDPLLTLLIAGYIIAQSVGLLREAGHILMEGTPAHLDIAAIERELRDIDEVVDVHHTHVWSLDEHAVCLDTHVVVDHADIPGIEAIKRTAKTVLAEVFGIRHSTLEFELPTGECPANSVNRNTPC